MQCDFTLNFDEAETDFIIICMLRQHYLCNRSVIAKIAVKSNIFFATVLVCILLLQEDLMKLCESPLAKTKPNGLSADHEV